MEKRFSRSVFVNTENEEINRGNESKIIFPPLPFSCAPSELMKLTLTSFTCRRNFYSINPSTNGTFYIRFPTATFQSVVIAPGTYSNFADLATAIDAAINVAGFAGSSTTYDPITRKFSIDVSATTPVFTPGAYFVCAQLKAGTTLPLGGMTEEGAFQDTHEILGAKPWRIDDGGPPVNAFGTTTGGAVYVSPYVASLNSMDALYLRASGIPSNNLQTYGFERDVRGANGLIPTQILARIPLKKAYFDDAFEFITYQDNGADEYSILIDGTQLSQMTLSLTDDKNRSLPEPGPGARQDGFLSFRASFRFDILSKAEVPKEKTLQLDHLTKTYQNPSV